MALNKILVIIPAFNESESIAKTIAENDERNHTIVNKYLLNKDKYKQTQTDDNE